MLSWSLETASIAQRPMAMRTTNKAGSSRRARRDQNAPKLTRDDRPHSTRSSEVIRYPERTKKVSTPRNPPGICPVPKWNAMTDPTATARKPSRVGLYPKLVGSAVERFEVAPVIPSVATGRP